MALKLEGEFQFFTNQPSKGEQKIKFDMNTKESRSFPVHFNCDLIKTSNTAKKFHGKIKAFSLGKLQGTVDLQGNLLYPTIEMSNSELNVVSNMLPCSFNITLANNSEIEANFKLNFKDSSTIITPIHERKQENLMSITQCLMKQKCNLRKTFFMPDSRELEAENILNEVVESENEAEAVLDRLYVLHGSEKAETESKSKPNLKSKSKSNDQRKTPTTKDKKSDHDDKGKEEKFRPKFDVEVTLKDIQKHFKHLTRGLSEVFYRKEKKVEDEMTGKKFINERSAAKLLKLSQTHGKLKPKESRVISVLFVGGDEGENCGKL